MIMRSGGGRLSNAEVATRAAEAATRAAAKVGPIRRSQRDFPTVMQRESPDQLAARTYGAFIAPRVPEGLVPDECVTNVVELVRYHALRGESVILAGEPGCGKSAALQAAVPDWPVTTGSPDRPPSRFFAWRDEDEVGRIVTRYGAMARAIHEGLGGFRWEELSRDTPELQDVTLSAFDWPRVIPADRLDGTADLEVPETFAFAGTANHAELLGEAFATRATTYQYATTIETLRTLRIPEPLQDIWLRLSTLPDAPDHWRPSIRVLKRAAQVIKSPVLAGHMIVSDPTIPSTDRDAVHAAVTAFLRADRKVLTPSGVRLG